MYIYHSIYIVQHVESYSDFSLILGPTYKQNGPKHGPRHGAHHVPIVGPDGPRWALQHAAATCAAACGLSRRPGPPCGGPEQGDAGRIVGDAGRIARRSRTWFGRSPNHQLSMRTGTPWGRYVARLT